jgi:accessory gene regulator B
MISESLTSKLVKKEIIREEEFDLYRFGFDCFGMKAIHIISYFILGLCFHKLFEIIIFLIAFIPLRIYAGGYHAKTPVKCYFISCCAIASIIYLLYIIPGIFMKYDYIGAIIASLILFMVVPVEASNKQLDEREKYIYKKRAEIIILIDLGFVFVCRMFKLDYISFIITLSLLLELAVASIGRLFIKYNRNT